MFKKAVLLSIGLLCTQAASAKVTALSNLFPDVCRQQLMTSVDDYPVVMVYRSDEPDQDELMKRYEELSDEYAISHPTRKFFKFDMAENNYNWQAYTACTQQQGIIGTPSMMTFFKFRVEAAGKKYIYMWGPLRLEAGDLSREDMVRVVEMTSQQQAWFAKAFASQVKLR